MTEKKPDPLWRNDMLKNVDSVFRVRWKVAGGHTHCSLFSALRPNATYTKCGDFVIRNEEFTALLIAFKGAEFLEIQDPRDPDSSKEGMFRDHKCYNCKDGAKPCVFGNPRQCTYPRARND